MNTQTYSFVRNKGHFIFLLLLGFTVHSYAQQNPQAWKQLSPPDTTGKWIQPAQGKPAMPLWGHAEGIIVGLAPLPGPRGLIRIYTPYLDYAFPEVMNFIAMEPVPKGSEHRGYSELEMSGLDSGVQGKRFWSSDDSAAVRPLDVRYPARGLIENIHGEETLTLYVFSEAFDNGAKVYSRIRFFESRPYEFEITTCSYAGSVELDYFVPSATMGNKARLRTLYLQNRRTSSLELWPDYKDVHFTSHAYFPQADMLRDPQGKVYFVAAPDEKNYSKAVFAPGTKQHWKYDGKYATQYWIKENPDPDLNGLVSGRFTYWSSTAPIPGGISIENFELKSPFKQGESFVFGIKPIAPKRFIRQIKNKPNGFMNKP